MKKNTFSFIFLIFFISIIILRFWKVPELFYFGIDEEYQSLLALSIIKDFHVIWIGLSAANTGFYIGPGLVYLHSLLLWFTKGNPIILAYAGSLIGVITVIILYFVAKDLFNKKAALLTFIIYGLSSFIIIYDRRFWNSTLVPLTVILLYYGMVKLKDNPKWLVFIAFLIGLSFHIHASLFIFIPIFIITIFQNIVLEKIRLGKLIMLISTVIFLMIYSPLIVFDLVHNFDNLKTPLRMLKGAGGVGERLFVFANIITLKDVFAKFWLNLNLPQFSSIIFFVVSTVILVWFFLKRKTYKERVLSVIIGFYIFMFIFYPGKVLDYYYLGFFPFFALIVGLLLQSVNRYLLYLFIGFFTIANLLVIFDLSINRGLTDKEQLIKNTIIVIGDRSFTLDTNKKYLYFGGWRYLFEVYGKRPNQSRADEMFGWIYPKEISQKKTELKVIVSDNDIITKDKPLAVIKSGIYRAYVFKEVER